MTSSRLDFSGVDFIFRRLIRIAPPYWFYTIAFCVAYLLLPRLFANFHLNAADALMSLGFIPHFDPHGMLGPIILVGWTLNFEMFFYCVFAVGRAQITRPGVAIVALFSVLVAAGIIFSPSSALAITYTSPLLLEFALGVVIGELYHAKRLPPMSPKFFGGLGIAALVVLPLLYDAVIGHHSEIQKLFYGVDGWRAFYFGIPAILLVSAAINFNTNKSPRLNSIMVFAGEVSYSVYLVHSLVFRVAAAIFKNHTFDSFAACLIDVLVVVAAIAASIAAYYLVEQSLTRKGLAFYEAVKLRRTVEGA